MADETQADLLVEAPADVSQVLLTPLQHALAAGLREAMLKGVGANAVLNMLLNQIASILARLEPPGVRADALKDVVSAIAPLTRQHIDVAHMTPGGVITPRPVQ